MSDTERELLDPDFLGECEFCGDDLREGVIHDCPEKGVSDEA